LERIRCVDRKGVDCYAVDEVGGEADPSVARSAVKQIRRWRGRRGSGSGGWTANTIKATLWRSMPAAKQI
jgi:hypothetical protein